MSERFFVTGGTLKPGAPSYIERPADEELWQHLRAGDYCNVLTARQMGKSSLMARTAVRLRDNGDLAAVVDLTQIGSVDSAGPEAWFYGVVSAIHRGLGVATSLKEWWQENEGLPPVQRFVSYFQELALVSGEARRVVFVDEIDSIIDQPWAADFFAAVRACFNRRATEPAFERLSFVLLGVATPNQLIADAARTPYNIGHQVVLTDFDFEEARPLTAGLRREQTSAAAADQLLERILSWTGGQPFLTQLLCRAVAQQYEDTQPEQVDEMVSEILLAPKKLREEVHLKNIGDQLTAPPGARRRLQLYRKVLQGVQVPDQPASRACSALKLSGVVKVGEDGRLAVRNRVYARVFNRAWVQREMPPDRVRQVAWTSAAAFVALGLVWLRFVQPQPYIEQLGLALDDYNVAAVAHQSLVTNPLFPNQQADELLAQFWERRALRSARREQRAESLLEELQALNVVDTMPRRCRANQLSKLFERLQWTVRHQLAIRAVSFSPDGETILTGSSDGTVRLWDTRTGRPKEVTLQHEAGVRAAAFSPDGETVLTGSRDGIVRLWDIQSGTLRARPFHHGDSVYSVAFSPDGETILTGSSDGTARLWDVRSGRPTVGPLQNGRVVRGVAFSPDGKTILTGDIDGTARLWDVRSRKSSAVLLPHEGSVLAVAFSPDGESALTGSYDGAARLWDVRSGRLKAELYHGRSVRAVAFSPDGETALTGSYDGAARLWDAYSGTPRAVPLLHQDSVLAVAFSPDGKILLTGSYDGAVHLWNVYSETLKAAPLQDEGSVLAVAFSPDGETVLTGSFDGAVRLWDVRSGRPKVEPLQHKDAIFAVALSPDGKTVLIGSLDGTAHLWEADTGRPVAEPLLHEGSVLAVAFSPDGKIALTGSYDGTARLWDVHSGRLRAGPLRHGDGVFAAAFSLDGETVLTGSSDGTARLWDIHSGNPRAKPIEHKSAVLAVALSPDGETVLTGNDDGTAHLWDIRSGSSRAEPLEYESAVLAVAFSSRGEYALVETKLWLRIYSVKSNGLEPVYSRLLDGQTRAYHFPADCPDCLDIAVKEPTASSVRIDRIHFLEPDAEPIEGEPKALLEEWQHKLGLTFNSDMKIVPIYPPSAPAIRSSPPPPAP